MSRKVIFYTTDTGKCLVEEFLNNLEVKVVKKIVWTLKIIEEMDLVPKTYFKKLESTDGIWEGRSELKLEQIYTGSLVFGIRII